MSQFRRNEAAVLKTLATNERQSFDDIVTSSNQETAAVNRAIALLTERQLVKVSETETVSVKLTKEGEEYANAGFPERRLIQAVIQLGGEATLEQAAKNTNIPSNLTHAVLGWLKRSSWCEIITQPQKVIIKAQKVPEKTDIESTLELISKRHEIPTSELSPELQKNIDILRRRQLVESRKRSRRYVELTPQGRDTVREGIVTSDEVSELTPDLITSHRWQNVTFRKYNLSAAVNPTWPGKKQPYKQFLDDLKTKLVTLGFEEMTGPTVETMFFNCDALFMPQDHPARDIHDLYFVQTDKHGQLGEYERFLDPVSRTHENGWKTGSKGWGYKYSRTEALRLILRSQGTCLSARTLVSQNLKIPGKYFSIVRCFRPDQVDRTHLTEFNQVEGIVVGPNLSLRQLLGVLQRFAIDIAGADRVRFKPDYFPFTEPSVELQAYKEGFGWLEFGGSGIFRPELTIPLGITYPVLAWGIGVDRLFMMRTGIEDIRALFSQDLDWIRKQKAN